MEESEYELIYTTDKDTIEFEYSYRINLPNYDAMSGAKFVVNIDPILMSGLDNSNVSIVKSNGFNYLLNEFNNEYPSGGLVRVSTLVHGDKLSDYIEGFSIYAENIGGSGTKYTLDLDYIVRVYNSLKIILPLPTIVRGGEG